MSTEIDLDGHGLMSIEDEKEFNEKWIEFSEIQCASWIVVDKESMRRFEKWKETGDPDEAWS